MKGKFKIAIFLFLFIFISTALSEKYIGKTNLGLPLHWDEIYDSVPFYLIGSTVIALLYLYKERKK